MSITDELREWVTGAKPAVVDGCSINVGTMTYGCKKALLAIADRIDEGAKDNELFRREAGPFCDRLMEAAAERTDVTLFGVDYVALPLDADGVPIRVGDELDGLHYEDGTVTGIQYGLAANGTISELVAVRPHGWDTATWHDPEEYRHHRAQTVEDVLREFADAMSNTNPLDVPARIAEYAAKLRLAEEVDA